MNMMRPYNFSAGPAAIPLEVLERAAKEMTDWHGCGMGVMEMSHRGKEFISIYEQAESNFRTLLSVPPAFKILFMQGGGLAENAIVPLNLSRGLDVDFVLSGSWSQKSFKEAMRYCSPRIAASSEPNGFRDFPHPSTWDVNPKAQYLHICTNETIHGVECHALPDLKSLGSDAPLVIDFSSHVLSQPVDWHRVGLAFAGAQKNIGPAGLTIVVVREDLLEQALPICPSAFEYATVAKNSSMYNTPPTYSIYMAGLMFEWLLTQQEGSLGGVLAMQKRNQEKARLLYDAIDASSFFSNPVSLPSRSWMNVPFFLADPAKDATFLKQAHDRGLLQLKGHKSVGGMRASIYNAMPIEGVQALVDFLNDFEANEA
jgi:phosphoserine aminotransferase